MKNKCLHLLCFIAIIFILNACKSTKEAAVQRIALAEQAKEERIHTLLSQALDFESISGSLRFSIKPGNKSKNTTIDGQLRLKKDELIQLSLRIPIIGSEAARVVITPEFVMIIDRLNKQYFYESMETIKGESPFDFDFYSLQALFSNHLFIAGKPVISETDFNSMSLREDEYFVYINNKDSQGINYDFLSDYTYRILKTEMYKTKEKVNMSWEYQDFGLTSNNRLFPMKMQMELTLPEDLISMNFSFSSVDVNTEFNSEVSIPSKYQQISFEQVKKLIKSL